MISFFSAQVQYGKKRPAPGTTTIIMINVTLSVHYPEPAMTPSEQAAIAAIYNQCASLAYACLWYLTLQHHFMILMLIVCYPELAKYHLSRLRGGSS